MPDADQRFLEFLAGEADRAQHGARAGTVVALRQSRALPLQRRRAVWIRHGFTLLEARFYVRTGTMRRHTARASSIPMSASTTEAILPEAGLRAEIPPLPQVPGETLPEYEGMARP